MDPNFVWENRKETVLETEDEIPFWVVRGDRKKVVSKKAHQALRVAINANRRLKNRGSARRGSQRQPSCKQWKGREQTACA